MQVIFDMETYDPDDFLTLLLLSGHPAVNLKAVTLMPGSSYQVGLVREALSWFQKDIPIGANDVNCPHKSVSDWHYQVYGNVLPSNKADYAPELITKMADEQTTIITGGPLKNIAEAIREGNKSNRPLISKAIVMQGGFAGEGVVPEDLQLPKFKGLSSYSSHNLTDHSSAMEVIKYNGFGIKRVVSKNVCHRVCYDDLMEEVLKQSAAKHKYLPLVKKGLDKYLLYTKKEKRIHDLLAACCAINPAIGDWREVGLYYKDGEWGAYLSPGSKIWIITDYNRQLFLDTLTGR